MLRRLAIAILMLPCLSAPALAVIPPAAAPAATAALKPDSVVVVLQTVRGSIAIQLDAEAAPKTAANFLRLVQKGFYNGTCFHRVIKGFMIQGGDPNSKDDDPFNDGKGGPGYTVPAEIGLPHVRGAVATARLGDAANPRRESNGSQFFIDVADRRDLDRGGYTVFAHVISGMNVVDQIVALAEEPGIARTAMGANPGKLAMIRRAYVEPLSKWLPATTPAAPPATKPAAAAADTTH